MLMTAPILIVANTANFVARRRKTARFVFAGLSLLLSVPAALATWAIVAVLSVLAIVPIEAVRSWLSRYLLFVTGWLGDAFIYTHRPLEASGAVDKVKRDLQWLDDRCDCIAVVAHSQGAAIAFDALKRSPLPNVDLFMTVGQGLEKLSGLRPSASGAGTPVVARRTNLSIAGVFLGALLSVWVTPWMAIQQGAWMVLLMQTFGVISLLNLVFAAWLGDTGTFQVHGLSNRKKIRWIDYYASADLVPNGPLLATEFGESSERVQSTEVFNYRSVLRDHTTYWDNPSLVASAVYELDKISKTGLAQVREPGWQLEKWVTSILAGRRRRTLLLHLLRAVNFGSVGLAWLWLDLGRIGTQLSSLLGETSIISWFTRQIGRESLAVILGSALIAFLMLLSYRVGRWAWDMLEKGASATEVFGELDYRKISRKIVFWITLALPIVAVVSYTHLAELKQMWTTFRSPLMAIGNVGAVAVFALLGYLLYRELRHPVRLVAARYKRRRKR
jgi:hypothetical protein